MIRGLLGLLVIVGSLRLDLRLLSGFLAALLARVARAIAVVATCSRGVKLLSAFLVKRRRVL